MSDLYLVLRRRLEDVTQDWVGIDGDVLVDARKRKGLSREAIGPLVGVVAKTWERYEKENRLPRQMVPRVAEVLELEIESGEDGSRPLTLRPDGPLAEVLARVDRGLDAVTLVLEHLEERLAAIEAQLAAPPKTARQR